MQLPPLNRISFNASSGELGRGFDEWLDSEPGQALLSEEKAMLTEWLRRHLRPSTAASVTAHTGGRTADQAERDGSREQASLGRG